MVQLPSLGKSCCRSLPCPPVIHCLLSLLVQEGLGFLPILFAIVNFHILILLLNNQDPSSSVDHLTVACVSFLALLLFPVLLLLSSLASVCLRTWAAREGSSLVVSSASTLRLPLRQLLGPHLSATYICLSWTSSSDGSERRKGKREKVLRAARSPQATATAFGNESFPDSTGAVLLGCKGGRPLLLNVCSWTNKSIGILGGDPRRP